MKSSKYDRMTERLFNKKSNLDKDNVLIYQTKTCSNGICYFSKMFVGAGLLENHNTIIVTKNRNSTWSKVPKVINTKDKTDIDLSKEVPVTNEVKFVDTSINVDPVRIMKEIQNLHDYSLKSMDDNSHFRILIDDQRLLTSSFLKDLLLMSRRTNISTMFISPSSELSSINKSIKYFDRVYEHQPVHENIPDTLGVLKIIKYTSFNSYSLGENYGIGPNKALFWGLTLANKVYFRDIDLTEVI